MNEQESLRDDAGYLLEEIEDSISRGKDMLNDWHHIFVRKMRKKYNANKTPFSVAQVERLRAIHMLT